MSTRIGIVLEKELYEKYKEYLFKMHKTIQDDLKAEIERKVQEYVQREQ